MYNIILVTATLLSLYASHPVRKEMVDRIRSKTKLWKAHDVDSNPFKDYSDSQLKSLLGTYF